MGIPRLMKMNKKGLEFKAGMFAIVAVSMLVLAFGVIISRQADRYGTSAVSEIGAYDKLSEISGTAEGYESSLTPEDPQPGDDPETSTFSGVYGIITGVFGAIDIVVGDDGMIDSLIVQFGLPTWVRQGIISMIFIAVAFSIVAVIFRLSRSSA